MLEHPEHVLCYIGCGQMYCFRENEEQAYAHLKESVLSRGSAADRKKLARLGAYPPEKYSIKALLNVTRMRALQGRLGLAMTMDEDARRVLSGSPAARFGDLASFALGSMRSAGLMKDFWSFDLRTLGHAYEVPVFYIMGEQDRTTPFEIAKEYFDTLEAPFKSWYSIPGAGHFSMLDDTPAWRAAMEGIVSELRG